MDAIKTLLILSHDPAQPPGCLNDLIARRGRASLGLLVRRRAELPDEALVANSEGVIVLGLPPGTDTEPDWLGDEVALLRRCRQRGQRVCGIGRGADILARAFDLESQVLAPALRGWFPLSLHPDAASPELLKRLGAHPPQAFFWQEAHAERPAGARALLSSRALGTAAWLDGRCLGLAFHATLDRSTWATWHARWSEEENCAGPSASDTTGSQAPPQKNADAGIAAQRQLTEALLDLWLAAD